LRRHLVYDVAILIQGNLVYRIKRVFACPNESFLLGIHAIFLGVKCQD